MRQKFIDEFRKNGSVDGREVRLRRTDGSEFRAINAWERYKTSSEEYVLSWVYDITDLRRTQEALLGALNEAESASRAKTEFLASMSHELRTPLNAILGFAQLMDTEKETVLSGLQRESVDHILSGGRHLLDLVDQVLDLAAVEEGRTHIEIKDVEVDALFESIYSFGLPLAANWQITVERPAMGDGFVVRADPKRLRQVLLNLMSNAVKYNRPDGSVSLACRKLADGDLRLEVIDTGMGIPVDKHHLVFEPFNRLGAETSSIEGTGIGLTISERLMRMMGGAIGFESVPNVGSTFWLELPEATSATDKRETASSGAVN